MFDDKIENSGGCRAKQAFVVDDRRDFRHVGMRSAFPSEKARKQALRCEGPARSKRHHIVFGRRGSGKTSLLRKAAAELTVDRRPIAFIDLEAFKGHTYPDVLLSVLISTFGEFATWLREAGRAPASKTSFWKRLFGTTPKRPPLPKAATDRLVAELERQVEELNQLLHSSDETKVKKSRTENRESSRSGDVAVGVKAVFQLGLCGPDWRSTSRTRIERALADGGCFAVDSVGRDSGRKLEAPWLICGDFNAE